MGQTTSKQRLRTIKDTVRLISQDTRNGKISLVDKAQYRDLLMIHSEELKLILSKTLKKSTIRKVEALITNALKDLEDLTFFTSNTLNVNDPQYEEKRIKLDRQILNEIRSSIQKVKQQLEVQHLSENIRLIDYEKERFNEIGSFDKIVELEKSKVLIELANIQSVLYQIETEEKLRRIEEKHFEILFNISNATKNIDNNEYKSYLLQLKSETNIISPIDNKELKIRKKYLLLNIDNNLKLLDLKTLNTQEKVTTAHSNLDDFIASFSEAIEMQDSIEDLESIYNSLSIIEKNLNKKLGLLKAYVQDNDDYGEVFFAGNINENNFEFFQERLKTIQTDSLKIRDEVFRLDFDKESHMYIDRKLKLEAYKNEINKIQCTNDNERILQESTIQCVDQIYNLLQNNTVGKKDSTDNILSDITFVNNKVMEIGSRLKNANTSLDDCDEMENELMNYERFLQQENISPARSDICNFRDYCLIQIGDQLSNLYRFKKKLNDNY